MTTNKYMHLSFVALIAMIFLCTFATAEVHKVNEPANLQFTCTVANQIPSNLATYNLSIFFKNGTTLVDNALAQAQGQGSFNYTVVFPQIETYKIKSFCYDTVGNYSSTEYISVTFTGDELTIGDTILYLIIMLLLVLSFSLSLYKVFNSDNIATLLATMAATYFLFIAIIFVSGKIVNNFMPTLPAIGQFLDTVLIILIVCLLPLILFMIIYVLTTMLRNKEEEGLMKMGYSAEESRRYRRR